MYFSIWQLSLRGLFLAKALGAFRGVGLAIQNAEGELDLSILRIGIFYVILAIITRRNSFGENWNRKPPKINMPMVVLGCERQGILAAS